MQVAMKERSSSFGKGAKILRSWCKRHRRTSSQKRCQSSQTQSNLKNLTRIATSIHLPSSTSMSRVDRGYQSVLTSQKWLRQTIGYESEILEQWRKHFKEISALAILLCPSFHRFKAKFRLLLENRSQIWRRTIEWMARMNYQANSENYANL